MTSTDRRRVLGLLGVSAVAVVPLAASPAQAQTRFKENDLNVYPASAFGAVGNGTTDDSAALQRAIDAASAAGGGSVHLGAGKRYLLGAPLRLKNGVSLESERTRATLVLSAGYSQNHVIDGNGLSVVGLRNLAILCDDRASLTRAVHLTGCQDVLIENVHLDGLKAGAYEPLPGTASTALLRLTDCHRVHVGGCRISKAYVGINVNGNGANITVDDCDFQDVTQFGLHVLGNTESHTEYLTVSRNRLERIGGKPGQVGYPIYITCGGNNPAAHKHRFVRAMDNLVIGNKLAYGQGGNADLLAVYDIFDGVFERNTLFYGGDAGLSTDRCRKLVISDNIVGHCNTVGINVWQSNDVTVTGNVVYNNHQNYGGGLSNEPRGGIRTYARTGFKAENVVISGNRSFDDQEVKTQDYGIFIHARTRGVDIGANTLTGNKEGMFRTGTQEDISYSFTVTRTAAPTEGWWEKGMVVQNRNPAAGQPFGWVCTVSGKPGTWLPLPGPA
ncbi:right-handed parallel beta-helix repeat-containing protein [Nonomuraea endophytica]|uniref:right-handed parallel beta-helix repeat-containing protein n=1 Tax=Nonomuraea endophytica TaxID=714136 RepID=UPI0037C860B0